MANTFQNRLDLTKNKSNSVPILPPINSPVSNENNLNKVLVLTKNDLDRITGHLNKRQHEEEEASEEIRKRKELHEKSLALTKNWNNTIQGSRRHKLEQKKIREENLEKERQQVDLEHAKYMAEERRKALENAKLLQYYETDRIKTFHSALKLSEVLKERDAQLEMRKILEKLNRDQEEEFRRQYEIMIAEKDKKDIELYKRRQEDIAKLTQFHKKQIEEHMEKIRKQKDEVVKDAEEIEKLNLQHQFEKEKLEEIRRRKVRELKETYNRALENKLKMTEAEKIMNEEENEEIRVYAAAKKKMAILRRQKEEEMEKEKEENRDRIVSYLGSILKQQDESEDFRIAKAVAKNEAKLAQEELFKNLKYQRDINEINQYRIETIKRKEHEKRLKELEEEEFMKKKMETDLMFQLYELEKDKKKKQETEINAKKNSKMAKERKEIERQQRLADKEHVAKELELMSLEDKQFEDYAMNVINYMEKHGRNTYPMKKVVYEQIYRNNNPDEINTKASEIKKHQNDVPTGKNLGFL